ncbi:uncharacterized protein LOC121314737 [Polyodon spathula]|uniref:uncharacterized protein LOC121314737 n=1 Tax=Polyodon spathula TaxID=7913 RepID=UPI001B7F182A|nr:uncharacterized protein LOC121314737 [Polyodon spathula]
MNKLFVQFFFFFFFFSHSRIIAIYLTRSARYTVVCAELVSNLFFLPMTTSYDIHLRQEFEPQVQKSSLQCHPATDVFQMMGVEPDPSVNVTVERLVYKHLNPDEPSLLEMLNTDAHSAAELPPAKAETFSTLTLIQLGNILTNSSMDAEYRRRCATPPENKLKSILKDLKNKNETNVQNNIQKAQHTAADVPASKTSQVRSSTSSEIYKNQTSAGRNRRSSSAA